MPEVNYHFIPMGSVAEASPGKVYIDVGNDFTPGVLDHHHPKAPDGCTATLALNHPDYICSQLACDQLTIVLHENPDLDGITGAYFARLHVLGETLNEQHQLWAEYVCKVDQGFTKLNPKAPLSPYSIFMMRMHQTREKQPEELNMAMLLAGFEFIEQMLSALRNGHDLNNHAWIEGAFPLESKLVRDDFSQYLNDLNRAAITTFDLPKKTGPGHETVSGLWIEQPKSILFKSWGRGDQEHSHSPKGFIFLGVQINKTRFILSVQPDASVWLKGLGDALELAEQKKRAQTGEIRKGHNRPGYQSPDPWYSGNSPLHHYTIIDSPRCGSLLSFSDVKKILRELTTQ